MQLRYVVARIIPDLVREEFINVGIILQSDEWVASKFIERIPRDWGLPADLESDIATRLDAVWKARLASRSEIVYLPKSNEQREVCHTEKLFLEWLRDSYTRHIQVSEIREADIVVKESFDFESFLHRLYDIFVAPKPHPRKPRLRSKLHTRVKQEFIRLDLPLDTKIRERDVVIGTFPWPIDFIYSVPGNGHNAYEVGIGLVDLTSPSFLYKAKDLLATWADVKDVRQDVQRISVVGGRDGLDEHRKAIRMVERVSSSLFVFDRQKDEFLEGVVKDLVNLPMFRTDDRRKG
ncbi:MAG TPA: DUF3037 domain-containing protein [Dehalococcoidia bacterium]|nr:DUF3037 domain-containing protein [Dehalococcoidia bacterium]